MWLTVRYLVAFNSSDALMINFFPFRLLLLISLVVQENLHTLEKKDPNLMTFFLHFLQLVVMTMESTIR